MSVKINGLKKLQDTLISRYGPVAIQKIIGPSLNKGAELFIKELGSNFESFKDTGASIDEITVSELKVDANGYKVYIHWKGPNDRYRLIHLNEWGSIKNPNPKGKGKVAFSLKNGQKSYRAVIKKELEDHL